ncbi:MAG: sigma-70 family RNA polymerase sigma factor [Tannerella sp.]|jgi:RNA polymerase sigma factor (sigma-70 family)|nr:sigma-70 family RNA polymerase sigma factor [Tannerella sp.]
MTQKQENMKNWNEFRAGDNQAYARIYRTYVKQMLAYGMCFSTDRELVKDCVQNVFMNIYENRSRLKDVDNVKLYLFAALKNHLFNLFEKKKEFSSIESIEPVFSVDYTIENQLEEQENDHDRKEKILKILDILTPRQKEVIYYRYMEEMDFDEIGKIMQMNYQSLHNLIQRSIIKIRKSFPDMHKKQVKLKK